MSEIIRLTRVDIHRYLIVTRQDERLGEWARKNTPQDAVFLTSMGINSWPMTCGARPIFLGFTGWMSNFGVDPTMWESALRAAFAGDFSGVKKFVGSRELYIVYGPAERADFPLFKQLSFGRLKPVYHEFDVTIYKAES